VVKKVRVKDGYRLLAGQVMVDVGPTLASADIVSVQEQLKTQASEVLRTLERCYQNRSYMPNCLLVKKAMFRGEKHAKRSPR
jgi:hypothetical protein